MPVFGSVQVPAKKPQLSVYLRPLVNEALDDLAAREQRSRSQMGAVLIEEALRARKLLQDTVGQDDQKPEQ